MFQTVGQHKHAAIYREQKHNGRNQTCHVRFLDKKSVQLPLQRGGKFRQQKGPYGAIACPRQVMLAAEDKKQEHQGHGHPHGGHPEGHWEETTSLQPQPLNHQSSRCRQPEPGTGKLAGGLEQKNHTGAPLGQSGKQTGHGLAQRAPPPR